MKVILKILISIAILGSSFTCSNKSARESEVNSDSVTSSETKAAIDFSNWNGRYFNEDGGIRLEGEGSNLKAFDADDDTPLEVELWKDGKVLIDGAEAFVSSDTLRLVLNGSGGSHETIYVRVLNDMN